ncbi:hypothetical protein NLU13_0050 [Sarocladium strictum]|uniref:Hydrophobin n=1 Tax=Sarocladium strictum TaxID=5046 RepID=A0AA39GNN2_SARSR|nr:hypothetical protein NLU13_0050 [Sarocladium strictum]
MKATFALILFTVAAFAVPFPSKDDSPGIELRGAQESGSRHARDYGDDHHHGGHHKDDDCDDGDGDGDDHDNDPDDGGDGDGHPAYKPCTVGRPQCCAAGLLGVVNIDCTARRQAGEMLCGAPGESSHAVGASLVRDC